MSAPYPYRVKGSGPTRLVYDRLTLVGQITRDADGVWYGWRLDGTLVRNEQGELRRSATIARWRTPNLWRTP